MVVLDKSVSNFLDNWTQLIKTNNPDEYKFGIVFINDNFKKPAILRSSKTRKRKKIIVDRMLRTIRNPKSRFFKNCYPVAGDVQSDDAVDKVWIQSNKWSPS